MNPLSTFFSETTTSSSTTSLPQSSQSAGHTHTPLSHLINRIQSKHWKERWAALKNPPENFSAVFANPTFESLILEGCLLPKKPSNLKKKTALRILNSPTQWNPEAVFNLLNMFKTKKTLFEVDITKKLKRKCNDPNGLQILEIFNRSRLNIIKHYKTLSSSSDFKGSFNRPPSSVNDLDTPQKRSCVLPLIVKEQGTFSLFKEVLERYGEKALAESLKSLNWSEITWLLNLLSQNQVKTHYPSWNLTFKAIIEKDGQESLLNTVNSGLKAWMSAQQLLNLAQKTGVKLDHSLWNRTLANLAITLDSRLYRTTIPIALEEVKRNPQGILLAFAKIPFQRLQNGFVLTENGEPNQALDQGGVTKHLFQLIFRNINRSEQENSFYPSAKKQKKAEKNDLQPKKIVTFIKSDNGDFIPGPINLKSPKLLQKIKLFKEIGKCLALALDKEDILTGHLFAESVYTSIRLLSSEELQKMNLQNPNISIEKQREIFQVLYPYQTIQSVSLLSDDKKIADAFRIAYSTTVPPEAIGGWNVSASTIDAARQSGILDQQLLELKKEQNKRLEEIDQQLPHAILPILCIAKGIFQNLPVVQLLAVNSPEIEKFLKEEAWSTFRMKNPIEIRDYIEGSRDISKETIVERLSFFHGFPVKEKQWFLEWLGIQPEENNNKEAYRCRLKKWLQAVTGVSSLPKKLLIEMGDHSGFPTYHTCANMMVFPKDLKDKHDLRRKIERFLEDTLADGMTIQ